MDVGWPSALVFWDVDHTLLDAGGFGRSVYEVAFQKVLGLPLDHRAAMAGRTDRAIVADTLALHGQPVDDVRLAELFDALEAAAVSARHEITGRGRALPGAAGAIRALADVEVLQSVVTGNIKAIAEVKLEAFGLGEHLDLEIGGYGADGSDRALLVQAARERAVAKYGIEVSPDRVFVIGDTSHDIIGARDAGVRSIGVATGGTSGAELAAWGPTAVLDDLTDIQALRRVVLGPDGAGAQPHW
jgi:phosphoglycolate phosphatase-like HAD superfamily hydrolase